MKSVIIGASAGLGRALAEELAARGHQLFLLASDERDLEALAADLRLRHGTDAQFLGVDLADRPNCRGIRDAAVGALKGVDNLFLIAGLPDAEETMVMDPGRLEAAISVNFSAPLALAGAFLDDLKAADSANIVGIGSVATARARKRNHVYGACKTGLEFYFQGLRHLLADTNCRQQFYRMGYLQTSMTAGKKLLLPALDPAMAARRIVGNLGRDRHGTYLPLWWAPVCLAYAWIPWPLFRRLDIK